MVLALGASACARPASELAIAKACPAMQARWPDRNIECSNLKAMPTEWGWMVILKDGDKHVHPGPVARVDAKLNLMDTVYLGS